MDRRLRLQIIHSSIVSRDSNVNDFYQYPTFLVSTIINEHFYCNVTANVLANLRVGFGKMLTEG